MQMQHTQKDKADSFFLRWLKSFNVCHECWTSFISAVAAAGAVFFAVVRWGNCMTTREGNRLDKLLRKCVSVMGSGVESGGELAESRVMALMKSNLGNDGHPLHDIVVAL